MINYPREPLQLILPGHMLSGPCVCALESVDHVSDEGVVGKKSNCRNTERLTLDFPNDEKLVLGTFCSGCLEDTCFTLDS